MTELIHFEVPLEVRAQAEPANGDGRTLEGRIVPYDQIITLGDGEEAFARGVFSEVEPEDVVLLWQHDTTAPIGRMTTLREEEDGAYGIFRLADTERAREARSLIDDGIVRGLSVGFQPDQTKQTKGVRTHVRARLMETSLVTFPAYPTAGVLAVREEERMEEPEVMVDETIPESPSVELAPIESRLDEQAVALREVRNQIANIVTPGAPPEPVMTIREAFAALVVMVAKKPTEDRALADVIGTAPGNASGLVPAGSVAEVLGILAPLRPLFSAAGTVAFPASGYGIQFPRITQHTQVAKRSGEKTEVASRELTVEPGLYAMEWFAGAVDVSLELIRQSSPSAVDVVVGDLLDQYAIVTEAEFATDSVAAATVGGAVLDFTNWGNFVGGVVTTSGEILTATGQPGNMLGLTSASWLALVKLLNPSQPAVSFGNGPEFTAEAVNFAGITAFHAPALSADLQFNQKALRKSESPPETVTATNVALMGRDIGILGATIALPLYPAGIIKHTATE